MTKTLTVKSAVKRTAGNKIHTINSSSFHGHYTITLRGPAMGFVLSPGQAKKVARAACPYADCQCGGEYGDHNYDGGAWIDYSGHEGAQPILRSALWQAKQDRIERAAWQAQMDREEAEGLAMMTALAWKP
jgi:hypothetical protein